MTSVTFATESDLNIQSMDYQYEGTYSCFAENSEGNATSLIMVEMLGKVYKLQGLNFIRISDFFQFHHMPIAIILQLQLSKMVPSRWIVLLNRNQSPKSFGRKMDKI